MCRTFALTTYETRSSRWRRANCARSAARFASGRRSRRRGAEDYWILQMTMGSGVFDPFASFRTALSRSSNGCGYCVPAASAAMSNVATQYCRLLGP